MYYLSLVSVEDFSSQTEDKLCFSHQVCLIMLLMVQISAMVLVDPEPKLYQYLNQIKLNSLVTEETGAAVVPSVL